MAENLGVGTQGEELAFFERVEGPGRAPTNQAAAPTHLGLAHGVVPGFHFHVLPFLVRASSLHSPLPTLPSRCAYYSCTVHLICGRGHLGSSIIVTTPLPASPPAKPDAFCGHGTLMASLPPASYSAKVAEGASQDHWRGLFSNPGGVLFCLEGNVLEAQRRLLLAG